ncbi:FmdB family zinc ribbon protein [Woeseia oceani]|uniref:FmdB family zinc ribbon protein n=1 Tax=Woeseia oceani TaxID=1548547 RepID=UPI0009F2AB99|nr:zinc ribbon domain-containing protein [Woeseia oceani]
MPIYEYACQKCAHEFDALQKMSDEPLLECPECGKPALKKLVSAPNFRLKGGGWYETDFKTDKQRNVHKSENDSSATTSSNSSAASSTTSVPKADSKPAAAKVSSASSSD